MPFPTLFRLILLLAVATGPALAGQTREFEIKPHHLERSYRLFVPSSYDGQKALPLVVSAHGGYGTGQSQQEVSGWDAVAEREGLLVAYPDGYKRSWNAGELCCGPAQEKGVRDVAFLRAMVEQIARDYRVDRQRIYGNGYSNGGMLMHYAACQDPGLFTAIATNASTLMTASCSPEAATPVLMIRGKLDERMPWDGGSYEGSPRMGMLDVVRRMAASNGCAATPERITVQSGPATCWTLPACSGPREVSWCGVEGVGHQWIGGQTVWPRLLGPNTTAFSSTETMRAFFRRHIAP
jgi:polyhydroxybutyrate depolymerase